MYPGAHAAQFPDKPAVVLAGSGECLTYRELDEGSARLARYLHDRGLRRGDHIALLTDNHPTAFEVYWAALRSGLYITVVNRHLVRDEVSYIINNCGAQALVVSAALAEVASKILDCTPGVLIRLAYLGPVDGYLCYSDTLRNVSSEPLPEQPRGADMLYSSGTTGRPKGIKVPLPEFGVHEPGDSYVAVFGSMYGFDTDTVYLSPGPIYHAAPLRFGGVVQALGGTVVLMEKFDPTAALAAIERFQVTHSQWVPTMFVWILKLDETIREKYDLSSLKVAIHAAAPCAVDVKRAMIEWWGPILFEYYSSTEGNGITFIDSEQWLRKPGSVGKAGVGTIHICDGEGRDLPAGQVGSVYFERDVPPFAYHDDHVKTVEAQHSEHPNWSTTGDVGYLDSEGYLFLTDRKEFMIISGGVNIYPQEIENALVLHSKVFDVAVIGVPDEEMGQSVKAVVQPAPHLPGSAELAEELRSYLRERMAHYKVPRSFDFVSELPRNRAGKLVKNKLLERYN